MKTETKIFDGLVTRYIFDDAGKQIGVVSQEGTTGFWTGQKIQSGVPYAIRSRCETVEEAEAFASSPIGKVA